MNRWYALPTTAVALLLGATAAQAGTAGYYGTCSFLDRGNDDGGDAFAMPCYVVEGANVDSAFFHLVMQDGRTLVLNATPDQPFTDYETGQTYTRVSSGTFSADHDGDVITVEDTETVDNHSSIDDPEMLDGLQRR